MYKKIKHIDTRQRAELHREILMGIGEGAAFLFIIGAISLCAVLVWY